MYIVFKAEHLDFKKSNVINYSGKLEYACQINVFTVLVGELTNP